jgi:hypothetical protein
MQLSLHRGLHGTSFTLAIRTAHDQRRRTFRPVNGEAHDDGDICCAVVAFGGFAHIAAATACVPGASTESVNLSEAPLRGIY